MASNEQDRTQSTFHLLPLELRSWTGIEEEARFFPERVILTPNWLDAAEADDVSRTTWNHFVQYLHDNRYMALLTLGSRIEELVDRQTRNLDHFRDLKKRSEEDWEQVWMAHRRYGADAFVEEAVEDGEWTRPSYSIGGQEQMSARVFAPESYNAERTIPLSVEAGLTWANALGAQQAERDDCDRRAIVARNNRDRVVFRSTVCKEVLRHYEEYGYMLKWDELEAQDIKIDGSKLELAIVLMNDSKRLAFIDEILWPEHIHEGGWPGIAKAFKTCWAEAGLAEDDLPYKSADPDEMNRKHSRYRSRKSNRDNTNV